MDLTDLTELLVMTLEAVMPRLSAWDKQQLRATCNSVRAHTEHCAPELVKGLLSARPAGSKRCTMCKARLTSERTGRWAGETCARLPPAMVVHVTCASQQALDAFLTAQATSSEEQNLVHLLLDCPPGTDVSGINKLRIKPNTTFTLQGERLIGTDVLCALKYCPATNAWSAMFGTLCIAFTAAGGAPELAAVIERLPINKIVTAPTAQAMEALASSHNSAMTSTSLYLFEGKKLEATPEHVTRIFERRRACPQLTIVVTTSNDPSHILNAMARIGASMVIRPMGVPRGFHMEFRNAPSGCVVVGPLPIRAAGKFISSLEHVQWNAADSIACPRLVLAVRDYAEDSEAYVREVGPMLRERTIIQPTGGELQLRLPVGPMDVDAVWRIVHATGVELARLVIYHPGALSCPAFATDVVALTRRLAPYVGAPVPVGHICVTTDQWPFANPCGPWSVVMAHLTLAVGWKGFTAPAVRSALLAAGVEFV